MTDHDQVQRGEAVAGLSMLVQLLLNIFNFYMQGSQKSMADPFVFTSVNPKDQR